MGYGEVWQGGRGCLLDVPDAPDTLLVQCKHWKAWKVGVKVVREVFGVMTDSHRIELYCHRAWGGCRIAPDIIRREEERT